MKRLIGAVLILALGVFFAPAALADTGNIIEEQKPTPSATDGWQAGTCTSDEPTQCTPVTPGLFFKQAAGHPQIGFTQYTVKQKEIEVEGTMRKVPVGAVATIRVDLPPGLTVNPEALPRCTLTEFNEPSGPFQAPNCPEASKTGEELVTLKLVPPAPGPVVGVQVPPLEGVTKVPVFNLVPESGEPALFGFKVGEPGEKESVFLKTDVAWESDFHEGFTIEIPPVSPGLLPWKSRLRNFGREGDGTFITNPTTCFDPAELPHLYSTWLRADSVTEVENNEAEGFPSGYTAFEATLPPGVEQEGCGSVPFEPGLEVDPGTTQVDSPSGATVNTTLKYYPGGEELEASHLKRAEETLPEGMGLNPSGADGLVACSDAQFKKGVRTYKNECPDASKVGTVEIESPPLSGPLKGDVYVGQQIGSNPESGEMFRILLEAKSEELGVDVRLVGNVKADSKTGQLTTVVDEQASGQFAGQLPEGLPQAPFTSVKLHFDGSKATLTTPPTCSEAKSTGVMEPWAKPGTTEGVSSSFILTTAPGGGACPQTLGARSFAPRYEAKSNNYKAGNYSPFRVHIGRPDGQQELKGVDITLPEGLTGNLSGIPYCPEASIAAAAANSGAAEKAHPSCPSDSLVGSASTQSGTGSHPITIDGNAYLAGPYKGAPLSLVVITPAVAGPFDLGTVVVRVALFVDPITTRVHSVADPIPHVFGGVRLDIRSVNVNLNRKKFMLNPTGCDLRSVDGALLGGGSDPDNPGAFSSYPVSEPFQAVACNKLKFKPKLHTRLFGGRKATRRTGHPKFRAILEAREHDANIKRSAVILSNSVILDQSHINTVCTRVQLAAHECPKGAIYGQAQATTPLLDGKLKGPVYMVSSSHKLPDLVADLRGQVNVQLHGVISSKRGGIKTVFNPVPDVPVKKFILTMKGGNKGLLINSKDLCKSHPSSFANLKAQNGKKVVNRRLRLKVPNCPKRARHGHRGAGSHRLG